MAEPFLAEIRMFSFNFAPKGWAQCNGQILPINQNQALFSILGTTYGGNGQTTFALPNLRGRTPIHQGDGFTLGQSAGETNHTINQQEMPSHNHFVNAVSTNSNLTDSPSSSTLLANTAPNQIYNDGSGGFSPTALIAGTISNTGGSQPHNNMMPSAVINFCIALQGIFPSRN
ncbi:MAG: tail fiber protein [Bacteroidota bacterium]